MANFLSRGIARAAPKTKISAVGATGIGGEPSVQSLQGRTVGVPVDRPNSLVGYTGGWTMGNSNPRNSIMNGTGFGNTGKVSANNF